MSAETSRPSPSVRQPPRRGPPPAALPVVPADAGGDRRGPRRAHPVADIELYWVSKEAMF